MLLATSAFRRGSSNAVIAASLRHQWSSCPRFLSSVSPTNGGDGDDTDDKQPSHHEAGVADAHAAGAEDTVAATIDHGADGAKAHSSNASSDDVPSPVQPSPPSSAKTTTTNNNNANSKTAPEQPGWLNTINLRPSDVVNELNRHIVGQSAAKRAVAIAMRNRWRRRQLSPGLLKEVTPRNVLMIGPTGCGKTEVARRMAKLSDAPFLKVEATKFTEVGYHGRDVDQIVRDLMDVSMALTKKRQMERLREEAKLLVDDRILDILVGPSTSGTKGQRESFRNMLDEGMLESQEIQIDVPHNLGSAGGSKDGDGAVLAFGTDSSSVNPQAVADLMKRLGAMGGGGRGGRGGFDGPAMEKKKLPISEAREVILEVEIEKMLEKVDLKKEAIAAAEESGIVFIDEIDKICSSRDFTSKSADASSEGVQRDLLPLVEGTTISTKYGNVDTDYMLFIASGAFHAVKPSDMLPELQGRLPIRVELNGLTEEDLYKILTEPEANVSNKSCCACALPYMTPNFLRYHPVDKYSWLSSKLN
jgi:ATP-dependent HslUV protease ATP-binding subunit HslU